MLAELQLLDWAMNDHDSRGLQRSQLIQAGGIVLKDIYCRDYQADVTPVPENYWHVWYGDHPDPSKPSVSPQPPCPDQRNFQDYGTAATDPDGKSFWVVHAYADAKSKAFKMVGAKVEPQ